MPVTRYQRCKARMYELLEPSPDDCWADKIVNITLLALIILNVIAVCMETVPEYHLQYQRLFRQFELFSLAIFVIEYIVRLWSCTALPAYQGRFIGRIRYAVSPLVLIDLCAILPGLIPTVLPYNLLILRAIRLFRVVRIFKVMRYSQALRTLAHVLREKREDLTVTVYFASILLVIASSLVYLVENPVQPDKFPSIPSAMWWGVVTLTTVGYGDVYPITAIGKILGGVIAFLGIGMFALPAGILGSGFVEEMQQRRQNTGCCPHCGRPYTDTEDEQDASPKTPAVR